MPCLFIELESYAWALRNALAILTAIYIVNK